jgi:hypothetical protein
MDHAPDIRRTHGVFGFQHIFMAGASDKKIYQWDARTNQVEQVSLL